MSDRQSVLRTLVGVCFASLIVSGCGASTEQSPAFAAPATSPSTSNAVVVGRVNLGSDIPGATLKLVGEDGRIYGAETTNNNGLAFFHGLNLPDNFRAVATVANSSEEFIAEVRGYSQNPYQIRVSLLTTLASHYLRNHPGISLAEAEDRVRISVRLLPLLDFKCGPEEPGPYCSETAIWRAAGEAGGWATFRETLLAQAEQNQGHYYGLSLDQLNRPIVGLEPGLQEVAERGRQRLAARFQVPAATGNAAQIHYHPSISLRAGPATLGGQFLLGVSTGIAGNLATSLVNGVVGWVANQLGMNYGTSAQLAEIESQLTALNQQVTDLITTVNDTDLQNDIDNLDQELDSVTTATQTILTNGSGFQITNQPFAPPTTLSSLESDLKAPDCQTLLLDCHRKLFGPEEILLKAQGIQMNQKLGVDRPAALQYYPWRSNDLLLQVDRLYGHFAGQQTLTLNLAAEQSHSFHLNNDTAAAVKEVSASLDQALTNLKQQRHQYPLFNSDYRPIVDYQNGVMWLASTFAPATYQEAASSADSLQVQMVMPDGTSYTYDDWRLPSYGELKSLQARGTYNPSYDTNSGIPAYTQNGYPDTGQTAQGLPGLGFQDVATAFGQVTGSDSTNCAVWLNYVAYADGKVSYEDNWEFRLNRANDDKNKRGNSDKNCYLICRTFGSQLLTNPYAYQDKAPDPPQPSRLEGRNLGPSECAMYGVPTAIAVKVDGPAPATVTYPFSSQDNPGGSRTLTLPPGSIQAAANITYEVQLGGSFTVGYGKTRTFSNPSKMARGVVETRTDSNLRPNELRQLVDWTSSDSTSLRMLNAPYLGGVGVPLASKPTTIYATLVGAGGGQIRGQVSYSPPSPAPHTLTSIQIMPRNQIYGGSSLQPSAGSDLSYPYYCLAYFADGSLEKLPQATDTSSGVNLTITSNTANLQLLPGVSSTSSLLMNQAAQFPSVPYNVTLSASYQGQTDSTLIQIIPPVPPP